MGITNTQAAGALVLLALFMGGSSSAPLPEDQRKPRDKVLSYAPIVKEAISRYEPKVPLKIALAVMHIESQGSPKATSYKRNKKKLPDGSKNPKAGQFLLDAQGKKIPLAKGLMQLIEPTAEGLKVSWDYNPETNIDGGVHLLSDLYEKYGDWPKVLAHYNSGSPDVIARKVYIDAVMSKVPLYKDIK